MGLHLANVQSLSAVLSPNKFTVLLIYFYSFSLFFSAGTPHGVGELLKKTLHFRLKCIVIHITEIYYITAKSNTLL